MYCPECATPNVDLAKFCRLCGTNLEALGLALSDNRSLATQSVTTGKLIGNDDWLTKESAAERKVVEGSVLLGVSSLIAIIAFFVTRGRFAWFPIWTVFFGWLTCWGTISLAFGLGRLIEARSMLRRLHPRSETPSLFDKDNAVRTPLPPSVTEHTTRQLEQKNL